MAVTVTQVFDRDIIKQASIVATADADTTTGAFLWTTAFPAGLTLFAIVTPILAAAQLSLWAVTVSSTTTLTAIKTTAVGSGNAAAQVLITVFASAALSVGVSPTAGRNPFALNV